MDAAPAPAPPVPTPPAPTPVAQPWDWKTLAIAALLLWNVAGPVASKIWGWIVPAPASAAEKAGVAWQQPLAAAAAKAFTAAAAKLDSGSTVADADAELKSVFQAERETSFATIAGPAFTAVLADGTEPASPAQRTAYSQVHKDFAQGLTKRGWFGR